MSQYLTTTGTTKKLISVYLKDYTKRLSMFELEYELKNLNKYFDWTTNNYLIFRNKKLNTYFATVVIDKFIDKNDMPIELLDKFKIILINYKPKENVIFTIDGLNCLIKQNLGTIDKSHKIDWLQYKNTLIIKNFNSELVMDKIEKIKKSEKEIGNEYV